MAGKSRRGFASMDAARQREIASKGGRAAHAKGTAHEWTSDEARVAGQKGGVAVSRDRAHMAAIGREGGESRSRASRAAREPGSEREMSRTVSRETMGGSGDRTTTGAPGVTAPSAGASNAAAPSASASNAAAPSAGSPGLGASSGNQPRPEESQRSDRA